MGQFTEGCGMASGVARCQMKKVATALFVGAVLSIGLTEYRPYWSRLGNLSDTLFLVVFGMAAVLWLTNLDAARLARLLDDLRASEVFLLAGILIVLGGV